ncbi:MAG: hypothetical protein CME66_00450 [Halobacteriovoraceae bacterium]|nr:hypothetical protein [Halobacteriovoraceae bacterium]|tara:strand:+ start:291 stop:791 length:501 start_codon:yes stop_codon:yes gene_type:complete
MLSRTNVEWFKVGYNIAMKYYIRSGLNISKVLIAICWTMLSIALIKCYLGGYFSTYYWNETLKGNDNPLLVCMLGLCFINFVILISILYYQRSNWIKLENGRLLVSISSPNRRNVFYNLLLSNIKKIYTDKSVLVIEADRKIMINHLNNKEVLKLLANELLKTKVK